MKFKVGDIVKAIDDYHLITNLENKFVGRIVSIESDSSFKAEVIRCKGEKAGKIYYIDPKHFKKMASNKLLVNDNVTVYWDDNGDKFVSKCHGEKFDIEKGLMMCLLKKHGYRYKDIRKILEDNGFNVEHKEESVVENEEESDIELARTFGRGYGFTYSYTGTNREVKVGDYFFVNNPRCTQNKYKYGDVISVKEFDKYSKYQCFNGVNIADGSVCHVSSDEGYVLENYKEYKKVNRQAKAGEYVITADDILRPLGYSVTANNKFLKCVDGKDNFVNTKTGVNVELSTDEYMVLEELVF